MLFSEMSTPLLIILPFLFVTKEYWLCLRMRLGLSVPSFPFEGKMVFYRQNLMIRRGAPVRIILNCNECKDEMQKMRGRTTKTAEKVMKTLLWNVIFI